MTSTKTDLPPGTIAGLGKSGAPVGVRSLTKKYGAVRAIDDVTLDIEAGEFVCLLGPSGSGKTTLLMSIAGFERPTSGQILVGGKDISGLPPHKRNLGVVFQRYALFPHMTVQENIGYALKIRGVPRAERGLAVSDAMDLLDLQGKADRLPSQLSGGQQQRVGLARALVYRPPVILFDEPLGALDRKLREQVQLGLRRLHRELGQTMVFVTHDQEEALIMSDKVAVMRDGRIEQFGTGHHLYHSPNSEFVAGFLGRTNIFDSHVISSRYGETLVEIAGVSLPAVLPDSPQLPAAGDSVRLAIRPEAIRVVGQPTARSVPGVVEEVIFSGPVTNISVRTGGVVLSVQSLSVNRIIHAAVGDQVNLEWDDFALRAFSA